MFLGAISKQGTRWFFFSSKTYKLDFLFQSFETKFHVILHISHNSVTFTLLDLCCPDYTVNKKPPKQICVNWNFNTVLWHCILSRQCVMVVRFGFWTQDVPPSSTSWMNTQHTIISIPSNLYLQFWHICFDMIQNGKDAQTKTTFVSVTTVKIRQAVSWSTYC